MLAAAIGVDRAIKADIGAVIGGDDALGALGMFDRFKSRQRFDAAPAVIEIFARMGFEASGPVSLGASPADAVAIEKFTACEICIAALAETFKRFEAGGLIEGHGISPAAAAAIWNRPCRRLTNLAIE